MVLRNAVCPLTDDRRTCSRHACLHHSEALKQGRFHMTAVLFPLRVRQAADGLHGRLSRRLVPGDQRGVCPESDDCEWSDHPFPCPCAKEVS